MDTRPGQTAPKLTPLEIRFFDSIEGAELIITESGEFILNPV